MILAGTMVFSECSKLTQEACSLNKCQRQWKGESDRHKFFFWATPLCRPQKVMLAILLSRWVLVC